MKPGYKTYCSHKCYGKNQKPGIFQNWPLFKSKTCAKVLFVTWHINLINESCFMTYSQNPIKHSMKIKYTIKIIMSGNKYWFLPNICILVNSDSIFLIKYNEKLILVYYIFNIDAQINHVHFCGLDTNSKVCA